MAEIAFINPMHMAAEFLRALGGVVSSFGFYEGALFAHIDILRRHPEVDKISRSKGFESKAELLRDGGAIAFAHAPTIAAYLADFGTLALKLGKERNILIHGQWMPRGPDTPMIRYLRKSQAFFYYPTLADIEGLERDINALFAKQVSLFAFGQIEDHHPWLTLNEKSAIQEFYSRHPEPPPKPNRQKPRHLAFRG